MRFLMRGVLAIIVTVLAAPVLTFSTAAAHPDKPSHANYYHFVGALHEHSGYSDGWPGTRPADYYAAAKKQGLDFLGSGEHSDSEKIPFTFSEECLGSRLPECVTVDREEPMMTLQKWEATLEQANAATNAAFTGIRGFEWTSDRFGHINVYFSKNYTNAKADGGYVAMDTFWRWFARDPRAGGGGDGLGTFNHPDSKKLNDRDPGKNWNDFAYVPEADARMVGIEVFNDTTDYGSRGGHTGEGWYAHTLDKGWHVGAAGAEDKHTPDWGAPTWAKTIIIAPDRSAESLREAMLSRRFYAVMDPALRLNFIVDGKQMGTRLTREGDDKLKIQANVNDPAAALEIVTSGGRVVATGVGQINTKRAVDPSEKYYFVRVLREGKAVAYSSPIWITLERD